MALKGVIPIDGDKLRELMERANIRQFELAEESGVSQSFVSIMLNGYRAPRPRTRERLRQVFLSRGLPEAEVNAVLAPANPDEGKPAKYFTFYIQGGDEVREVRRRVKIAAAATDMSIKDYISTLYDEAGDADPLSIVRAAKALAARNGQDLEAWVQDVMEQEAKG